MRAIGYVRVSTDKQAAHGVSLEAQEAKIRAMAVVQDAELAEVIVDAGESAKSLVRPGMVQLLALVDERKVDILERFRKRAVSLVSVAESLDTGSAAGRLVINIMTSVSQWEREAIGERTRDAMSHKKSNGERVGNIAYGYRLGADGEHLEPDPDEQAVLAAIRDLHATRCTLRSIAAELNARGLRTRRASAWRLESVVRVIRRESVVQ
jgi:site-specific DNA recombinase